MQDQSIWRRLPWRMLAVWLALIGISLVCIASASLRPGQDGVWIDQGYHKSQLMWLGISLAVGSVAVAIPYLRIGRYAWVGYLAGILLLLAVLFVGRTVNGAQRWLDLKFMRFQPSELVKLTTIVMLAWYLRWNKDHRTLRGLAWTGAIIAIPMALILKQPDLGTSLVFPVIWFAMLFVAGAKKRHLGLVAGGGISAATLYVVTGMMKPYQWDRLTAFLDPGKSALSDGYHLLQSKTGIGAGGLLGHGFAGGTQNTLGYLPENHSDFIFSVVGEEWGLLGAGLVLALYLTLLLQILLIAYETREPFGRLLCVGIATWIGFQIFVNVGMTIGLMPITGLTLPFMSYGGSSLMILSLAMGLVVNVKVRQVVVI